MKLTEDFNEIPTLGFITSTQFAMRIWNLSTVLRSIHDLHTIPSNLEFEWMRLENEVKSKAKSIIGIPSSLKEDLVAVIIPIGKHIKEIRLFLHFSPDIENLPYLSYLHHWTLYGTVDTESFERMLANDRRLSNWFRFSLACNDCFEDIIDEVFELVKDKAIKYKGFTSSREMQIYWTFRKSGDVRSFVSTVRPPSENIVRSNYTAEELAFMHSIKKRNRAGIEYFLNYLPRHRVENITEEHFSSLIDTIVYGGFLALPARLEEQRCDALYFLLSRLNGNVRDNILRQNAFLVLNNFLRYPFFGLFDKYATLLVSHLKEDNTLDLLRRIVLLQFQNEHLFGYELFKDFWSICPEEHKTYVKKECITYHFPGQGLVLSAIRDVEEATAT